MKPTVHYVRDSLRRVNDKQVTVYALDHPRLCCNRIITSEMVTLIDENGNFETLNTLYVAVDDDCIDDFITEK